MLVVTYSEFGRRVEENGSTGTDHGTAAPMFAFGNPVAGGIYGPNPDLADLDDDGDLRFDIDFRQVYATVLDQWLGANSAGVIRTYRRLGAKHELLGASRQYHGEWRSPVVWSMHQFAPAYHALAFKPAEATAHRTERDASWPLL